MKKRILASLLALCMLMCLLPVSALAAEGSEISIAIDDTSAVAEYEFTYYEYDYNLASAVKHAVETKAADAGITVSDINKLTISTSGNARVHFADCRYIAQEMTGLTTLDITNADFVDDGFVAWSPDSTNIDHKIPIYAFDQASQIQIIYPFSGTSRDVSTKFTAISSDAFAGTGLCGEIMIPKTVVEVSGFNKTQITGVNKVDGVNYLDGNIETIGGACFLQTSTLAGGIVFGEKVTSIGWGAFSETQCSGDIVFGGAIKEIGNQVLRNCKEITSVRVGSQVTSCSTNSSFENCTKLESVIFEDGAVATIGPATFNGCNSLDYVYFGDKCTLGSTGLSGSTNIVLAMEEEATNGILNVTGGIVYVSDYSVLKNMISTWHINPANLVIADLGGGKLSDQEIFPENTLAIPSREGYISGGWYEVTDPKATDWTLADAPLGESSVPENGKVYLYKWTACSHNVDKAYTAEGTVLTQKCSACGHVFGTATLTAPENLTYDGNAKEAAVTTANDWEGDAPTIEYYAGEEKLTGAPADAGDYAAKITAGGATASLTFTIAKAAASVSIAADKTQLTGSGTVTLTVDKTGLPADAEVTVTCDRVTVTANQDGTYSAVLPNETKDYIFTVAYAGDGNHETASAACTVSVTQHMPFIPVTPSIPSTTTETVTNPDGSRTTIVTDKKSGTVTATTVYPNGVKTVTIDEPGRNVTTSVTIPRSMGETTVTIPADVTPGTVAVDVKTGEIVMLSVPTAFGMLVKLDGSAELVLEDRSKDFTDTRNHWAGDAIDFAVAHGLFSGISETSFAPDRPMTRAMLMTVLARFDGVDTAGGATWYEKGMEWAKASGVSDGTNPDSPITREQLAAMLYRYAGSPAVDGSIDHFSDAGKVSGYAVDAMRWAVSTGIISGMGDGTLAPQANATRAQVAVMLMRFCINLIK